MSRNLIKTATVRQTLVSVSLGHSMYPTMNETLISPTSCRSILDNVTLGQPASLEQAKRCAEILISTYPRNSTDQPEVYARAVISILQEHAPDIGAEAVDAVTRERYTIPSRADLNRACLKISSDRSAARATAERHLIEHERRSAEEDRRAEAEASWGTPEEKRAKIGEIMRTAGLDPS